MNAREDGDMLSGGQRTGHDLVSGIKVNRQGCVKNTASLVALLEVFSPLPAFFCCVGSRWHAPWSCSFPFSEQKFSSYSLPE